MPGTKRRIHPGLIERLRDEPYRFEFFQAVRLLLAQHRKHSSTEDLDTLGQVIRFRSSISLGFPPSEIESADFEWPDEKEPCIESAPASGSDQRPMVFRKVTLTPSFMGLTGPMGVLPRHYTQHVAERETYHRDTATRAFLDIFNTRAIALFYQSWLKYRLHLQYESDQKNRFLPMVLGLAGLGLTGTRERLQDAGGIGDESLAYYVAALGQRPQSIQWFSRVVSDYFGVTCSVGQFVGQWFELPDHELSRLGMANCGLGTTALCGGRVWDRQTKVRLTIGPMRQTQFDDFLPNGTAAKSLKHFFRLMVGATFDCEVCLILDKRDVVPARLNTQLGNTRLGWNGWVMSGDSVSEARDARYLIKAGGSN
jgi:type VI secretion system protein ImpH